MGARIFRDLGYTQFADSCLIAAERANNWHRTNPIILYDMDGLTNPTIGTGNYPVNNERHYQWMCAEAYITTGRQSAYDSMIAAIDGGDFYNTPLMVLLRRCMVL